MKRAKCYMELGVGEGRLGREEGGRGGIPSSGRKSLREHRAAEMPAPRRSETELSPQPAPVLLSNTAHE